MKTFSPKLLQQLPPLAAIRAEIARRERAEIADKCDEIRERCKRFSGFVRESWHVCEPNCKYIHSWHVDAIAEHLEAVTHGKLTRLLINVPPGSMKSLLVSVLWQAWEWGPMGLPSMRFLSTAFNDGPVTRDTRKCRDLMLSEWYRQLWPSIKMVRTAEMSFANDRTGTREGVAFGSLTSQRGDRLIIDDPHSTETAESDAERARTTRKFREGAVNRLNNQERSAIVIIMQRLHELDLSGVILKNDMGYEHLCLPMEFETGRRCRTSIGFEDPRGYEGELLAPERFPQEAVDALKRDMGSHAFASQYQQRPTPREGALFKRQWFSDSFIEPDRVPVGTRWVRHWDLAATSRKTAARTAGVKLGRTPSGGFIVGHVVTTQSEGHEVRELIKAQAILDGKDVEISLPQDPGQAGKVQARDFISILSGWNVHAEPETGDKATRAEPFSAQCEAGNVKIVIGAWNDLYLDELCTFPAGAFKDQVDATSGAFGKLTAVNNTGFLGFYSGLNRAGHEQ